jgi:hypothetical protein
MWKGGVFEVEFVFDGMKLLVERGRRGGGGRRRSRVGGWIIIIIAPRGS